MPIVTLIAPPPWDTMPVLRYGTGGDRTDVVCGYLHSEDRLFDPALRAFPPVFVVRPPAGPAAQWVESSIDYALASRRRRCPRDRPRPRLPELLLVEVLRCTSTTAPAIEHGWIAALHDPVLAPAMAELHRGTRAQVDGRRARRRAAVSRSLLDERFRQVLGRSPIRYLTEWRMHIADDLLATTDLGVGEVARRVGYDSEEAFSRAFKRSHGIAPSPWHAGTATCEPAHLGRVGDS